eukprot:8125352-Pyramimonas_sp.AAC.1
MTLTAGEFYSPTGYLRAPLYVHVKPYRNIKPLSLCCITDREFGSPTGLLRTQYGALPHVSVSMHVKGVNVFVLLLGGPR